MSVNLGFIGFGLTGGSLAKAIKAAHRDYRISAYDTDRESLVQAKKEGILDTIWDENRLVLDQCDFLFLCAPGECNCAYLKYIREDIVGSDCILTDVGNLKSHIHQEVEKVCLTSNFIGGHPLFCQDAVGYANAKAELITQAPCYLLTPSEDVSFQKLTRFTELITSLGVSPMVLTAQEHDYI
ncbi:MAG: prephenate dehydrogenase/arogenate dehydrogenase family protein, partial [Blautia sp.]